MVRFLIGITEAILLRDLCAGAVYISVRTRKTDSGSESVVEDDGRGFDHAGDRALHITPNHISQWLEIMCGGSLTITSHEGGGVTVTATIPTPES